MLFDRRQALGSALIAVVVMASSACASAKTVTLKYTTWGSTQEVKLNKDIIARFEAQNPGVKVKLIYIDGGNYFAGLLTQMAAGSGPDVMYINPQWSFPLYKMGALKDLSAYFKADKDLLDPAIYYTQAYDGVTYNGSRYGTTNGTNIQSIFYNTTLVANAGLREPSDDWTYTDFVEYAQKMTLTANGKPTQLGFDGVPVWYGSVFRYSGPTARTCSTTPLRLPSASSTPRPALRPSSSYRTCTTSTASAQAPWRRRPAAGTLAKSP